MKNRDPDQTDTDTRDLERPMREEREQKARDFEEALRVEAYIEGKMEERHAKD
ncbi:hypothetical protein ES708_00726 [subsurface metagenome]